MAGKAPDIQATSAKIQLLYEYEDGSGRSLWAVGFIPKYA